MSFNILAQQKLDEMESKLKKISDVIEKIYVWSTFISLFSKETQLAFDKHYNEFMFLCKKYVNTPDPFARKNLKEQIKLVSLELQHFNSIMTRVSSVQTILEKALISQ